MYRIKNDFFKKVNQTKLAEFTGMTQPVISNILNGKVLCRKVVAYCITKYLDSDAEIEDFFTKER